MRRSQGAVLGAVMEVLQEAGDGETVHLADLDGLIADGGALSTRDVSRALNYLTQTIGVTRKVGPSSWEVVALAAIERARDYASWFDDADLESTWVSETRRLNAGKYPKCPTCGMTLGLQQDPLTCENCT